MKPAKWFIFALACFLACPAGWAAARTQVRLLSAADSVPPGGEWLVGVELKMPPRWHTYWRNAGDAGGPTEITWNLPPEITAGPVQWPVPARFEDQGIVNYGYDGTVLLLVPLRMAATAAPGRELELQATVAWIECEKSCIPGEASVSARVSVGAARPSGFASAIEAARRHLPASGAGLKVSARWTGPATAESRPFILRWNSGELPEASDFFPFEGEGYTIQTRVVRLESPPGTVALQKTMMKDEGAGWPRRIGGLMIIPSAPPGPRVAYEVTLDLTASPGTASPRHALPAILGLAFLGGLILNIMPCVLPVIALKALSFVSQSRSDPRRVRRHSVIYSLGVLASFLVLAGLVIGVQQAGGSANWGMQFQNPQFLVAMTVLVTLVALNLFGVFEITLGSGVMSAAGQAASREGGAGAFFNGVLATLLATPCTAPALSIALGFAFAQPPALIVLVFSAIAAGLAAPYLALSWRPELLRLLPRPGAWMQRFKVAMGFPMLATALWLFSLTLTHFEKGAAFWLGLFLVALALAVWIWGEFVQRGTRHRGLAMGLSVALALTAYLYVLENELRWRAPVAGAAARGALTNQPGGIEWQAWSREAVERARTAGHPVLVDFTADWCATCLLNKKTSLEIPAVRDKLREVNAVALLADYTRKDPVITAELKNHGRAAVPLVLVYPADASQPPRILPEILRPSIVLEALSEAAARTSKAVVPAPPVEPAPPATGSLADRLRQNASDLAPFSRRPLEP